MSYRNLKGKLIPAKVFSPKSERCKENSKYVIFFTPHQVNPFVAELTNSSTDPMISDRRGQHTPRNKLTQKREEIRQVG